MEDDHVQERRYRRWYRGLRRGRHDSQVRLIYTSECGWIVLGHANPEGKPFECARDLWDQMTRQTSYTRCLPQNGPARIKYGQIMKKFGISTGEMREYAVDRILASQDEQQAIALAIF